MSFMKSDTLRRAMARLRPGALPGSGGAGNQTDAAEYVRQTLARHGLAGDAAPRDSADPAGASSAARQSQSGQSQSGQSQSGAQAGSFGPLSELMSGSLSNMLSGAMSGLMPDGQGSDAGLATHTEPAGARDYLLHVPETLNGAPPEGLVLMLHGCTQTPRDFAAGTAMNALADQHRLIVVYPAQARGANAQSCWNWFSRGDQQRDRGEPSILAGMVRAVAAEHDVPEGRIYVAGLSAGAAMAVILGETYPEIFAAVGAHSGLPYAAARDVPQAFAAMRGELGARRSDTARPVPTIVFHGSADGTVAPSNGARIHTDALGAAPGAQLQTETSGASGGRSFRRTSTTDDTGAVLAEYWQIEGLGHAWSGGDRAGTYTDAAGPDASAEMIRFFQSVTAKA